MKNHGCHALAPVELARAVGPTGMVYGVDISDQMLALTRELLEKEQLAARVVARCGEAEALPCEDASLDEVFMSFTLELFDTPEIPAVAETIQKTHADWGPGKFVCLQDLNRLPAEYVEDDYRVNLKAELEVRRDGRQEVVVF